MMKRKALALVLAAGFVVGGYATDARVAVMGRQSTPWFYRDEVSVFNNPADMSLYPNMLYGSFGHIKPDESTWGTQMQNTLPQDPHFGAMVSHRFGEEDNGPMFSIGVFLNRRDYMVDKLLAAGGVGRGGTVGVNNLLDPVGKIDLLLGYDLGNGVALGMGGYAAFQREKINTDRIVDQTELFKGSLGINWNVEQGLDFEASINGGITNARYTDGNAATVMISERDYFLRGDVRIFSAVPAINGSFVPQVSLQYITLAGKNMTELNGGVGINMNIDRGFFWAGLQGIYDHADNGPLEDATSSIGGRISFGIERNIMWDWFLIRVGGQKEIRYNSIGDGSTTNWSENRASSGFDNDLVGLGFGINIDNRLRIDFVASEDLPYTFTNLISGSQHHLFNRVSATYRF